MIGRNVVVENMKNFSQQNGKVFVGKFLTVIEKL